MGSFWGSLWWRRRRSGAVRAAAQSTTKQAGPILPGSRRGTPRRTVALVALGLDDDGVEAMLQRVTELRETSDYMPLVFSDIERLERLAAHDCVFEQFPSARVQSLAWPDLAWDIYLQRRLDLLQDKWQPIALVPFGEAAGTVLRQWRDRRAANGSGWQGVEAAS